MQSGGATGITAAARPSILCLRMFLVAMADGVITMEERVVLHVLAEKLGVDDETFDRTLAAAEQQLGQS